MREEEQHISAVYVWGQSLGRCWNWRIGFIRTSMGGDEVPDGWEGERMNVHFPRSSRGERESVVFVYLVHVRHLSMDLLGWMRGMVWGLAMIWF